MIAQARRAEIGVAAMVLAMFLVPLVDVIAKLLTDTHGPAQIGLARFAFQTLYLAGVLLARRIRPERPSPKHGVAGLAIALSVLLFIWSLKYLPVAAAVAIFLLSPLLFLALSHVFLEDRMDRRRLAAVLAGFGGALLAIRPNWEAFGWVAILPLASAACHATYLALTKSMVGGRNRVALQFWIGGAASGAFALVVAAGSFIGEPLLSVGVPDAAGWLLFAAMGAAWTAAHLMIAAALNIVRASVLSAIQYLEILGATFWGFIAFGALPDSATWFGGLIIVVAGLCVIRREPALSQTFRD